MSKIKKSKRDSPESPVQSKRVPSSIRERILEAAFTLFREQSFSAGDPGALAARYISVLWGDLLIRLLMRAREAPTKREIEVRARAAMETLMVDASA